jgi:hypothetical protein
LKRLIDETEELTRQIRNLKSRIKRRGKKLVKTFDPLESGRVEAETKLLQKKVLALTLEELKRSLSIIGILANLSGEKTSIEEPDWSKAGKA